MHPYLTLPAQMAPPVMNPEADALERDLGLGAVLEAMSDRDPRVLELVRPIVLSPLTTAAAIRYRQQVLAEFHARPDLLDALQRIAADALAAERGVWRVLRADRPSTVLHEAAQSLQAMLPALSALRQLADARLADCASPGVRQFLAACQRQWTEPWVGEMTQHLRVIASYDKARGSARLGRWLVGADHRLRRRAHASWLERLHLLEQPGLTLTIPDRDEAGLQALSALRDTLVVDTADIAASAAAATRTFLRELHEQTTFYRAALRLMDRLEGAGQRWCVPDPVDPADETPALRTTGLCDIGLSLRTRQRVVGNDLDATGRPLVLITGANSGGKSTFLRALGLAQLLLQCGLPVAAEEFCATLVPALFTHYRREEDAELQHGKLDEELARMSALADLLEPGCLLLCNESFASTNDREGSAIARDIVEALVSAGVRVGFVTHLNELPVHLYQDREDVVFLRASRDNDGSRSYRLQIAPPLPTGYALDLYEQILGTSSHAAG
jgi:DNA mismatch repair ATPase MutS